jgi:hypothetical protein
MLLLNLPLTVGLGDTAEVRINGLPAQVLWRDFKTLVILPYDARRIIHCEIKPDRRVFLFGEEPDVRVSRIRRQREMLRMVTLPSSSESGE